ncbi:hypothetical protein EX30DRAFT_77034 [Ascodesmis nigricans]|uniref:Uncharacterized protein n=1 Tax=Ascodesmis nigricans TaxID=341454 RepID=A0A4S2MTL7_9PEZI|nr:hypothetical protein EX30DRAFT_77034 [Ascodesmis nigricans]
MVMTKPPATKFPLATKKDIRDAYTDKISEVTDKIATYFGDGYTLVPNFEAIYPYAEAKDYGTSIGSAAFRYFESVVTYGKNLTDEGANDDAKSVLAEVIPTKTIKLVAEEDDKASYTGVRVNDEGELEIYFREDSFYSNTDYCCENIAQAIDEALFKKTPTALPLVTRKDLRDNWLAKKTDLEKELAEELNDTPFTLHFDAAAAWEALVAAWTALPKKKKSEIDLEAAKQNLGYCAYEYFSGLKSTISYRFGDDELMIEGFLEAVDKKEAHLVVVQELSDGRTYNDCVIEGETLLIRTVPGNWGVNTNDACEKLVELL